MHQKADIGQREAEAFGRLPQALHQTTGRIGRRCGSFPGVKLIGSGVEDVQVREAPPRYRPQFELVVPKLIWA
jgi:hypothetical protein